MVPGVPLKIKSSWIAFLSILLAIADVILVIPDENPDSIALSKPPKAPCASAFAPCGRTWMTCSVPPGCPGLTIMLMPEFWFWSPGKLGLVPARGSSSS